MEPRPLPADLSIACCADAAGWAFHVECTAPGCAACCSLWLRLVMQRHHCEATPLLDVARRLCCKRCGARPTRLHLTDHPDRMREVSSERAEAATVIDLLPLLGR